MRLVPAPAALTGGRARRLRDTWHDIDHLNLVSRSILHCTCHAMASLSLLGILRLLRGRGLASHAKYHERSRIRMAGSQAPGAVSQNTSTYYNYRLMQLTCVPCKAEFFNGKPASSHPSSRLGSPVAKPSPGSSTGPKHDKRPTRWRLIYTTHVHVHAHPCPRTRPPAYCSSTECSARYSRPSVPLLKITIGDAGS